LDGEPFASRLYTVPAWWISWHSLFVAVPAKPEWVDSEQEDKMKTWTDLKGQKWEIKSESSGKKMSHRRVGEGDDKWKDGSPLGWKEKPMVPLR
jgi:TRAP-type uncharacterized transport system substrate-binding protein